MKVTRLLFARASVLALVVAAAVGLAPAHASRANDAVTTPSAAASGTLVATISAPMNLDCSQVSNTPQARKLLAQNHLCGYGSSGSGITPNGTSTVQGNCGNLTLSLWNHGGGTAERQVIVTSKWGPMFGASYTGTWTNYTDPYMNGKVSASTGLNGTTWTTDAWFWTEPGLVAIAISAQDNTILGTCVGATATTDQITN